MNYAKFEIGQEKLVSELVWDVFNKYEAPVYPEEGIDTFKKFITPDNLANIVRNNGFKIYCCFDEDRLVGVLALRDKSHISLLFVHDEYHKQGIAKTLLSRALIELKATNGNISKITVNSSPYAQAIYEKLGFTAISKIQQQDGILYIPMFRDISQYMADPAKEPLHV